MFRDDDPQSGNSNEKIYDLDAPGVVIISEPIEGNTDTARVNYEQWVSYEKVGTIIRYSLNRPWFLRINVALTDYNNLTHELTIQFSGDNVIAFGQTTTTYDLQ